MDVAPIFIILPIFQDRQIKTAVFIANFFEMRVVTRITTNIDFLIKYAWKMGLARLLAFHPNEVWNDWMMVDIREGKNAIQDCSVNFEPLVAYAHEIRGIMKD